MQLSTIQYATSSNALKVVVIHDLQRAAACNTMRKERIVHLSARIELHAATESRDFRQNTTDTQLI
jgi:hypothetical protein